MCDRDCGALFFSGFRDLVVLGWLNLVGLIVVMLIKSYAFTSVWCAYAAVVSVVIYFFFSPQQSRSAFEIFAHRLMESND